MMMMNHDDDAVITILATATHQLTQGVCLTAFEGSDWDLAWLSGALRPCPCCNDYRTVLTQEQDYRRH